MYTQSDNVIVNELAELLVAHNVRHAIIAPGSRNAPLIISLHQHPLIKCYSITDERSAAFVALGMVQKLRKPVAMVCTSGTAMLNFGPAIAEAYYQMLPIIVISADRPQEWIDQSDSQAIQQANVFANFSKGFFQVPLLVADPDLHWFANRGINEILLQSQIFPQGPVHINIPLREPLYGSQLQHPLKVRTIDRPDFENSIGTELKNSLLNEFNNHNKIMILCGMLEADSVLSKLLQKISLLPQVVILCETISNLTVESKIQHIDRIVTSFDLNLSEAMQPDLLITIGINVISKRIKSYLRSYRPQAHWHLGFTNQLVDTYQCLTRQLDIQPEKVLEIVTETVQANLSSYAKKWQLINNQVSEKHSEYIKILDWCDLKAFSIIWQHIPTESEIQLGNSTPVRYAQLMPVLKDVTFHCNRGTSGIDGCTSTAVGFAMLEDPRKICLAISGDISFIYDNNALWNNHLPDNLRIIVFNNQGGSIFRYIPGPDQTEELEEFFETHHQLSAKNLAIMHNVEYFSADNAQDFELLLTDFWTITNRPKLIELFTPRFRNPQGLKNYFDYLKTNL